MKIFQYILIFVYTLFTCLAQDSSKTKFFVGGCFQTTIMNSFNFNQVRTGANPLKARIPHNYEKNIQGLGIPGVLRLYLNHKYSFDFSPTFRFDEVYFQFDNNYNRNSFKEIILNSTISMNKVFSKKNHIFKTGISIYNIGKTIPTFLPPPQIQRVNLQFSTLNIGLQFNMRKHPKNIIECEANIISRRKIFVLDDHTDYISYNFKYLRALN